MEPAIDLMIDNLSSSTFSPLFNTYMPSDPPCNDRGTSLNCQYACQKYMSKVLCPGTQDSELRMLPLCATSYDNVEENLYNVLYSVVKSTRRVSTYWSSHGSNDQTSSETISFSLREPVAVIRGFSIRPFAAWFQRGMPIYGPKRIRFTIGGIPLFADPSDQGNKFLSPKCMVQLATREILRTHSPPLSKQQEEFFSKVSEEVLRHVIHLDTMDTEEANPYGHDDSIKVPQCGEENLFSWTSPEFDVENIDEMQHFSIPSILCINGYLRLDLIGRCTRQHADMKYYTCLGRVICRGYPVRGMYVHRNEYMRRMTNGNDSKLGPLFGMREVQRANETSCDVDASWDGESSSESETFETRRHFAEFLLNRANLG
jgi:hypothetical protein